MQINYLQRLTRKLRLGWLGCPDEQDLFEEAEAYHVLTDDAPPFPIGKARSGKGWLLETFSVARPVK